MNNSLSIRTKIGDKNGIAACMINIAGIYFLKKDLDRALKYAKEGNLLALELNSKEKIKTSHETLYKIYDAKNQKDLALFNYIKYIEARDSVFNEENTKKITRSEMQFDFDKKLGIDSVKNAEVTLREKIRHEEEIKQQRIYTYSGVIGFAFMIIIAGISFKAFKTKQKANIIISAQKNEVEKQKDIIAEQKQLVEEHQKEIIDSITYAKRIQQAILPSEKLIGEYFPKSFILYKPKDIVAGDFYWMETISMQTATEKLPAESCILFAAADCTGHGVPGALVSVVCSNALNRSVNEFGIRETGKILDKTRDLVLETFLKNDNDVKDGMDISLVSIELIKESTKLQKGKLIIPKGQTLADVIESMKRYKIQWSGANNPLWYFKNGRFAEVIAHKQPIGKTENPTSFPTHTIELNKGDVLYLFTDGFADQFGGPKGKKFKYKQLQEILSNNIDQPVGNQKQLLSNAFENWRGSLEQVDDVCIIGIQV